MSLVWNPFLEPTLLLFSKIEIPTATATPIGLCWSKSAPKALETFEYIAIEKLVRLFKRAYQTIKGLSFNEELSVKISLKTFQPAATEDTPMVHWKSH